MFQLSFVLQFCSCTDLIAATRAEGGLVYLGQILLKYNHFRHPADENVTPLLIPDFCAAIFHSEEESFSPTYLASLGPVTAFSNTTKVLVQVGCILQAYSGANFSRQILEVRILD